MITTKDLHNVMPIAEPLFERLQDLYGKMPETICDCEQPGICCSFLPEMTALEALQWIWIIQQMPDPEATAVLKAFVAFYFTNPARISGCPFLKDGGCTIYPYRTFGCRAYGLWSQKLGKTRTQESRKSKKALKQMWKRYGIDLPAEVVEFEIDYCDKVRVKSDKPPKDSRTMKLLQDVYDLSRSLGDFQTKFEEEYHSDFSLLLASLLLGMRKALLEKFAVIKEIVQEGSDGRLQKILDKVSPDMLKG
jgi:Fe-S-cluster containining protein